MKRKSLHIIICIFIFSFAFEVMAEDKIIDKENKMSEDILTLTLKDTLILSLKNHYKINNAKEEKLQGRKEVTKAYSQLMPKINVNGSYTEYFTEKTNSTFTVQPDYSSRVDFKITQPIYSGGRASSALKQAKAFRKDRVLFFEETKENVVLETVKIYFELLKAQNSYEINRQNYKRLLKHRDIASINYRVGRTTESQFLLSESEVARAYSDMILAENNLRVAKLKIKKITKVKTDISLVEIENPFTLKEDIQYYLHNAEEKRNDYKRLETEVKSKEATLSFAKSNFMPSVTLDGVYSVRDQSPVTSFFVEETSYATVSVNVPVFAGWLRMSELSQAKSKLRVAKENLGAMKDDIIYEVQESFGNSLSKKSLIEAYEKELIYSTKSMESIEKQFKYGAVSIIDLHDENSKFLESKLKNIEVKFDYILSLLELNKRSGLLVEEINSFLKGKGYGK